MRYIFITICAFLIGCQSLGWESLHGLTKSEVKNRIGSPVSIMREKNSEIWTYKQERCTKYVFFDTTETVKYVDTKGTCWK